MFVANKNKSRLHAAMVMAMVATALGVGATAIAADKLPPEIPKCDKKIGTLAVKEPERNWWGDLQLESPEALIKIYVRDSNCFTLVDRGKGLQAAQVERELASSGDLRGGSNVGKGQIKAADYVLIPDVSNRNARAGGTNVGGLLGGMLGGTAGALLGGISLKSKTADVVLTLTDVRSTEQVSLQEGHAKKTDLGWTGGGAGYWGGFAAAGASSYANTEIGQIVAAAYLDAFTRLVNDVRQIQPDAKADNVSQSVLMAKPGRMYETPDVKGKVVRDLDPGMMLYPTGEKQGMWWKTTDELGNEGWVPSTLFELAK
jgi:curli biogenesis system outer membrane secretion channel CsgG